MRLLYELALSNVVLWVSFTPQTSHHVLQKECITVVAIPMSLRLVPSRRASVRGFKFLVRKKVPQSDSAPYCRAAALFLK